MHLCTVSLTVEMCSAMIFPIVSAVQCEAVQCSVVQYSVVQCIGMQFNIQSSVLQCIPVWCSAVQGNVV